MRDLILIAVTALVAACTGALLALWFAGDRGTPEQAMPEAASEVAGLSARVAALEEVILFADAADDGAEPQPRAVQRPVEADRASVELEQMLDREQQMEQERQDQRLQFESRLRQSGWSETDIQSLDEMQVRATLEMEQRQFDALRKAMEITPDLLSIFDGRRAALRSALGDERYEQLLEASGADSAMDVRNVLPGSPGHTAGLQRGDEIRRYGSRRVFDEQDLMMAMVDGEPGETVTIEVVRDGTTLYLSVPRGPLGMSRTIRIPGMR